MSLFTQNPTLPHHSLLPQFFSPIAYRAINHASFFFFLFIRVPDFFPCVFFLFVLTGITDNYNSIAILHLQVSFFSSPPPYLLYCLLCHLPSLQPSPVVHILLLLLPFAFCFRNPPHHQSSSVNHINFSFLRDRHILSYPTLF